MGQDTSVTQTSFCLSFHWISLPLLFLLQYHISSALHTTKASMRSIAQCWVMLDRKYCSFTNTIHHVQHTTYHSLYSYQPGFSIFFPTNIFFLKGFELLFLNFSNISSLFECISLGIHHRTWVTINPTTQKFISGSMSLFGRLCHTSRLVSAKKSQNMKASPMQNLKFIAGQWTLHKLFKLGNMLFWPWANTFSHTWTVSKKHCLFPLNDWYNQSNLPYYKGST